MKKILSLIPILFIVSCSQSSYQRYKDNNPGHTLSCKRGGHTRKEKIELNFGENKFQYANNITLSSGNASGDFRCLSYTLEESYNPSEIYVTCKTHQGQINGFPRQAKVHFHPHMKGSEFFNIKMVFNKEGKLLKKHFGRKTKDYLNIEIDARKGIFSPWGTQTNENVSNIYQCKTKANQSQIRDWLYSLPLLHFDCSDRGNCKKRWTGGIKY